MLDEAKIREAVEKAKAAGWTIADQVTVGTLRKQCCPLGAVSLTLPPRPGDEGVLFYVARMLGVAPMECTDFAMGFDGDIDGTLTTDAYKLGAKFRRELLK